jgi:hypothetical protein
VGKEGAFHAITKSELLGEAHGGVAHGDGSASGAQLFHHLAAVMRFHLLLHEAHDLGRAHIDPAGLGWWFGLQLASCT